MEPIPRAQWLKRLVLGDKARKLIRNYDPNPFGTRPEDGKPMIENEPLLASVCQFPDDDTPRLMYADWLDETAGDLPRKYAEAYACRAELIRLQTDVARGPGCKVCGKVGRFTGTHYEWCRLTGTDPANTDVPPDKVVSNVCVCGYYDKQQRVRYLLDSTYAIPTRIPGAADARVKGAELWKPAGLMVAREVRYLRGFVGVAALTMNSYLAWVDTLCKAAPLERIVLADRQLNRAGRVHGKVGYLWAPDSEFAGGMPAFPPMVIPESLWDLTAALRTKDDAGSVDWCYEWLARAATVHARTRAFGTVPHIRTADGVRPMFGGAPAHLFDADGVPVQVDLSDPDSVGARAAMAAFLSGDADMTRYKTLYRADLLESFREAAGVLDFTDGLDGTLTL